CLRAWQIPQLRQARRLASSRRHRLLSSSNAIWRYPLRARLRREKLIEGAGENVGRHARPRVAHANGDILARLHIALLRGALIEPGIGSFDGNTSSVRHRVARVDAEIEKSILKLVRIAER